MTTTDASSAETAAAVVEELARRFREGGDAFALFATDARLEQPVSLPRGGWHEGHDRIRAMGATFAEHCERTIGPARILGCGDTAVQVTEQTWTAWATGRSATVDVVELFEVRDGIVSEVRVFQQDTAALLATLDMGAS